MVSQERAREVATEFAKVEGRSLSSSGVELETGWYFAWDADGRIGSHGFAVSKATGDVFQFGSAFSVERDLRLYDKGLNAPHHDLVVLGVLDFEQTVSVLEQLRPTVVEPTYESGTVWRVRRQLTRKELRDRLVSLPAVFPDVSLYFVFEALEDARAKRYFDFELLPRRSK